MTRHAPLTMTAGEFKAIGHRLVDLLADRLAAIPDGPVTPGESVGAGRAALASDLPLPQTGDEPGALVLHARAMLFDHSLFNGHPRFFGYITSSPSPIGMFGDLIAAAVN